MDKSKLKKLLTTTSALIMVSGLSSTAMGALFKDNAGDLTVGDGQAVVNAVSVPGGTPNWTANDSLYLNGANNVVLGNVAGATVGTIDMNNNAQNVTVAINSSVGSIISTGGNPNDASLIIKDGKSLTLTTQAGLDAVAGAQVGGIYTGLGTIILGHANGGGATLNINSDATFAATSTIDGDAANRGVINVMAAKNVTFNGVIGGVQPIDQFNVAAGATANVNADASANTGFKLAGTGRLKVGNGITLTGVVVADGGAGNGVLEFLGAGVVTGKIGNAAAITELVASGAGAVDLQALSKAQTFTVAHAGADIQVSVNGATGNVNYTANGQVSLAAGSTLTGDLTTISNADANGTNGGKLVSAAASTVTGAIGTVGNRLDTVEVTGAGLLDLTAANGVHYARQFLFKNNAAIIQVAGGGSLTGNAVANVGGNGNIYFAGNGSFTGTLGTVNALAMVKSVGAGIVQISAGNHIVDEFQAADNASVFTFADGANITGKIDNATGAPNATIVNFLGSGSVSSTTGQTNGFSVVNLKGDANSVVKFGNTLQATNINIGNAVGAASGTLEMNDAGNIAGIVNFLDNTANGTGKIKISGNPGNHTIGKVVVAQVVTGSGEIEITSALTGRTITLGGQIGDSTVVDKYLKKLTVNSGAVSNTVTFDANSHQSHISEIAIGAGGNNGGAILNFTKAVGEYKIATISSAIAGKGVVKISHDTEFKNVDVGGNVGIKIGVGLPVNALEFNGDRVLIIPNGSEIYAQQLNAGANGNGTITFAGDATFSAVANTNSIKNINVNGAAKTVKILKDLKIDNGQIKIVDTATLEISGNIADNGAGNGVKIIGSAGANQGILKFTNTAAITLVQTRIGQGGNFLKTIEFAGGNVDISDANSTVAHNTNDFVFSGANAMKVTFNNATDVTLATFRNTNAVGITHTVVLGKTQAFNGAKLGDGAAGGNGLINFQLANGTDATLDGATTANGANFTTGAPGTGKLEFLGAGITVNSVGTDGNGLAKVTFTESGGIAAGTFATEVKVNTGKTATLGGRVKSDNLHLEDDLSKVIFADGAIVDSITKADAAGKGLVEFAGSGTLNQDISVSGGNKVAQVLFADDVAKTLTLNANITSGDVKMRKGIVKLAKDVTVIGTTVTAAATTFDLGSQKLNASTLAMSGTNNITFAATVNGNAVTGGQIVVSQGGGVLAYAAGTAINVLAQDAGSSRPTGGATRTFTLIANNTGTAVTGANALDVTKVKVDKLNPFTDWIAQIDANGGLVLVQEDNALEVLKNALGSAATQDQKDNLAALSAAATGTDAEKVVAMMSTLVNADGSEKVKGKVAETMDRLTTTTTVTDNIAGTGAAVSNALGARLDNLAGIQQTGTPVQTREVAAAETGISAGEESARYGVWATPFYNQTTQKARKGAAGYKGTTFGGSFGFDTRANDDLIIGAAVTVANSEMKHKNFKSGDKTKVGSMLFSIYGMQQMTDAWFVNGIATFGTNDVKNNERRVSGLTTYDTVRGNYTSMSFNGEVMFGYGVAMQQVSVTPMVGLRYSRVNDGGYTETGSTTGQNLKVNTKASNKMEAIAGARLSGGTFDVNGMNVTPEIHAFVNQDLIGKTSKPTITLAGAGNLATKSRKPIRTTFNVGAGVMANYGMMEYGAGYDADIADKRIGHTGTLKIRVNF